MKIYKCSFCGSPIMPGYGVMYVKSDGTIQRYCSRKCRISAVKFMRNPRKVAWVRKRKKSNV